MDMCSIHIAQSDAGGGGGTIPPTGVRSPNRCSYERVLGERSKVPPTGVRLWQLSTAFIPLYPYMCSIGPKVGNHLDRGPRQPPLLRIWGAPAHARVAWVGGGGGTIPPTGVRSPNRCSYERVLGEREQSPPNRCSTLAVVHSLHPSIPVHVFDRPKSR